jgi:hypothetical protein
MPLSLQPFHLAIPVDDIAASERFYVDTLGCTPGRRGERWIDFDFFGHQLSAHLTARSDNPVPTNPVDGEDVPVRHFGVVLDRNDWQALQQRLLDAGAEFLIKPTIRFAGQPGEQATFFLRDPSGNALEFKSFLSPEQLFAGA